MKFPEWNELSESIQLRLEATGYDKDKYEAIGSDVWREAERSLGQEKTEEEYERLGNQMRGHMLSVIPWADLPDDIREVYKDSGWTEELYEANRLEKESIGFCETLESRVLGSPDLRVIIGAGEEVDYNRQIAEWARDSLVPDAVHVLRPIMVHRHRWFEVVEPHMRAHAWLRVAGHNEAVEAIVDIPMDLFNQLQTISDFQAEHGMEINSDTEWTRFLRQFWDAVAESGGPQARKLEVVM